MAYMNDLDSIFCMFDNYNHIFSSLHTSALEMPIQEHVIMPQISTGGSMSSVYSQDTQHRNQIELRFIHFFCL